MSEKILFVLEGAGKEPKVLDALWPLVHQKVGVECPPKVVYTFCTHIYTLFSELKADPDLDLLRLLKEDDPQGALVDADDDTFSSIYLFFDYDGHVNMPRNADGTGHLDGDVVLGEMLGIFSSETDNGKLFLSYPMVEAIQHLDRTPQDVSQIITAKCKGPHCLGRDVCADRAVCPPVKEYKSLVARKTPRLGNISRISSEEWINVVRHHIATAALMLGCSRNYSAIGSQSDIFDKQLTDYISRPCPQVAVLSAFPLFIFDYFGAESLMPIVGCAGV